jgi:DNA-binding beta-propeller fold protein YncE
MDLGRIGPNNLPVYVASVTYGQIMMFSATATASAGEIQGALSASYNGFVGGGSASLSAEQRQLLETADIRVVTLGGNGTAVRSMISGGNPADFFIGSDLITNAVPIAYTLKDLNGNVAKVAETSDYTLTTCTPNGFANFYVTNLSSATGYYGDGTQASLNVPIEGLTAPVGVAYDSLDDWIFVLSAAATTQTLRAYQPDGSLPEPPIEFTIPTLARGLTYDPQRGRLYVIGNFANVSPQGTVVLPYTPAGAPLGIPFVPSRHGNAYAAAYDSLRERIYVTFTPPSEGTEGEGFVVAFGFRGEEVPLTGGFDGLDLPEGIAYDATHDRFYVSDYRAGTVTAFDPEGNSVTLDSPITGLSTPRGLHFDSVGNRLYVLESGASVISVFEPDGTPVTNLTVPSFPNLNRPYAIAFRP